jgi:hypothetical protein
VNSFPLFLGLVGFLGNQKLGNWNSMAEVLGGTHLISSCHHSQGDGLFSVFPKKSCTYKSSSSVKWFQPLNLTTPLSLRSSFSSRSDFHGRRFVLQENKFMPKRGNFRFQPAIFAQVGNFLGTSSPFFFFFSFLSFFQFS